MISNGKVFCVCGASDIQMFKKAICPCMLVLYAYHGPEQTCYRACFAYLGLSRAGSESRVGLNRQLLSFFVACFCENRTLNADVRVEIVHLLFRSFLSQGSVVFVQILLAVC